MDDAQQFDWLARIMLAGQRFEVRHKTLSGGVSSAFFFADSAGLDACYAHLSDLDEREDIEAVWFTLNPLRRSTDEAAKDADVLLRRWLLIDVDPVRPAGQPSTEEEKSVAFEKACDIRMALEAEGWTDPLIGDSGNGVHLLMPVALPNDDASRHLCQSFLREVAERFADPRVKVDVVNYNAARVVKVYGSTARKGDNTPERPWRRSGVITVPDGHDGAGGTEALNRIMARWKASSILAGQGTPATRAYAPGHSPNVVIERARKYLDRTEFAVSGQRGHDVTFRVAAVLVHGFSLTNEEALVAISDWNARCSPPWTERELTHKLDDARARTDHGKPRGYLLTAERASPVSPPTGATATTAKPAEEEDEEEVLPQSIDEVARAVDLIAAGAKISWAWPDWIAFGVLTVVAAEAGCGKTRFVLDLMRRVRHGLGWPDGQAIEIPADSRWLYMMADDNHAEVAKVVTDWGMEEAFFVPATKNAPFEGTRLDGQIDRLRHFVSVVRPKFVVVDTVGSATMHKMHASDEVELLTRPLRQMAREYECAILGLTHLNAAGGVLGRRVVEKARQVVMLNEPDRDGQPNRRALWVDKSNANKPPALGVTMANHGNEYDAEPPTRPEDQEPGKKRGAPRTKESETAVETARQWLHALLASGERRVNEIITIAEQANPPVSKGTLYRCKDLGMVEQVKDGKYNVWRLPLADVFSDVQQQDILPIGGQP